MEQEKREAIVCAASRIFARFGFKKTSIDEVAREAGVAKGTIYLACQSKEDLFYQALLREIRSLIADVSRLIDPRRPADELLVTVAQAALAAMQERPLVRDLFIGLYHGTLPGWGPRLDELRALGRANLVELLELGIRQGRFRENLDVEQVATLLQDLQLAAYLLYARGGPNLEERLTKRKLAAFDFVLRGLLHPKVLRESA